MQRVWGAAAQGDARAQAGAAARGGLPLHDRPRAGRETLAAAASAAAAAASSSGEGGVGEWRGRGGGDGVEAARRHHRPGGAGGGGGGTVAGAGAASRGEQLLCKVHQAGTEALRHRNQVPEMPGLTNEHASIHLTVDVPPGDARLKTARFRTAARKEAEGLQDRGAFRKTKRCDLPPGANVIKGRFVFTLKEFNTPEEQPKARDVAQGQSDKAKAFVVHSSSTLRQRSTRIILSTSINNDFRIFFHDITQAGLPSESGGVHAGNLP